jgi:hypothetical protein
MSGFLDRYKTDKSLEEEGVWVDFGAGVQVKIARITSSKSKDVRRKLERPMVRQSRGQDLTLEQLEYLMIEQLAQAVVKDWKGVTDEEGNPLPFSEANCRDIISKFPDFREDIATVSMERESFRNVALQEELGNS